MKRKIKIVCFVAMLAVLISALTSASFFANAEDIPEETDEVISEDIPAEVSEEEKEGALSKEWLADKANGCYDIEDILSRFYFSEGTIDRSTIRTPDLDFRTYYGLSLSYSSYRKDDEFVAARPLDFWESEPDALSWVVIECFNNPSYFGRPHSRPYIDALDCLQAVSDYAKEHGRPFMEPQHVKAVDEDNRRFGQISVRTVLSYNEMKAFSDNGYGIVFYGDYGPGCLMEPVVYCNSHGKVYDRNNELKGPTYYREDVYDWDGVVEYNEAVLKKRAENE